VGSETFVGRVCSFGICCGIAFVLGKGIKLVVVKDDVGCMGDNGGGVSSRCTRDLRQPRHSGPNSAITAITMATFEKQLARFASLIVSICRTLALASPFRLLLISTKRRTNGSVASDAPLITLSIRSSVQFSGSLSSIITQFNQISAATATRFFRRNLRQHYPAVRPHRISSKHREL